MKKVLMMMLLMIASLSLVGCFAEEDIDSPELTPSTPEEKEVIDWTELTPSTPKDDESDIRIKYVSQEKFVSTEYSFEVTNKSILEINEAELLQSSNSYITMTNLTIDGVLYDFEGNATSGTNYEATKDFDIFATTNSKVIIDTYNPLGALRIRVSSNSGSILINLMNVETISFGLQSNASAEKVTAFLNIK